MIGIYDCQIIAQTQIAPQVFRTLLKGPKIARAVQPGQFVTIRVVEGTDPLLRRPFSIHAAYPNEGMFSLLYVVRGRGTELLARMRACDKVNVAGPLGKPFDLGDDSTARHIIVAGGCGAAPLHFLCDALCKKWGSSNVLVMLGAQTKDVVLCEADFRAYGVEVIVSTDDGSYGCQGLVSDVLEQYMHNPAANVHLSTSNTRVYACGPRAMLKEVARICKQAGAASCQVALENHMACGMGVCLGCVQKIRASGNAWKYKRVCADGPVFDAEDVIWD